MITAIDTNVLLDVFMADAPHHSQSREWLRTAYDKGALLVCEIVYAELAPSFGDRAALEGALQLMGCTVSPIDTAIAYEAGIRWMRYRKAGGPRKRIIPDFLIGAHALGAADRLLTRDRGFFATYFPELNVSPA